MRRPRAQPYKNLALAVCMPIVGIGRACPGAPRLQQLIIRASATLRLDCTAREQTNHINDHDYWLSPSARFVHQPDYVIHLLGDQQVIEMQKTTIREQYQQPVEGCIIIYQAPLSEANTPPIDKA